MKPFSSPCCNKRIFDIYPSSGIKAAKLSKNNKRTADIVLKCFCCGNLIAVRFPRGAASN